MKAISICQPWAYCITNGTKRVENRTWGTKHRGWTLIHAGKKYQAGVEHGINADSPEMDIIAMRRAPRGGLVGVARMVDCIDIRPCEATLNHPATNSMIGLRIPRDQVVWTGGPYAFLFDDVFAFPEVIPYPGALGFFEVYGSALDAARDFWEAENLAVRVK